MDDARSRLEETIARATAAWQDKWERDRSAEPAALYDFTYHAEFGGGRKLGMKLRTDEETGIWVKSYLEAWPSARVTFGFVPVKGGGDGQRGA